MNPIRQSTAITKKIGPIVNKFDGYTPETGTIPTIFISKNGSAFIAKNDSTPLSHDRDGYFTCSLNTSDTDTVGSLVLEFPSSGNALPIKETYHVFAQDVFDSLYAEDGTVQSAEDIVDFMFEEQVTDHTGTAGSFGSLMYNVPVNVLKKFGVSLVASGTPTTTEIILQDVPNGLTASQLDNALILNSSNGQPTRITDVTVSGTNRIITVYPEFPSAPQAGDEIVVFAQYIDSLT